MRRDRKATKHVPIFGDQFTTTGLGVSERSKTFYLQFVDKLIAVERLYAAGKPYRAQIAWQHAWSLAEGLFLCCHGTSDATGESLGFIAHWNIETLAKTRRAFRIALTLRGVPVSRLRVHRS
jgi:hypothetical protein